MKKAKDCLWLKDMKRPANMPKVYWERMLVSFPHLTMADRFAAEQLVSAMARRARLQMHVDEYGYSADGKATPEAKALAEVERLYFNLVRDLGGSPKGRQEKVTREDRSSMEGSQFLRA